MFRHRGWRMRQFNFFSAELGNWLSNSMCSNKEMDLTKVWIPLLPPAMKTTPQQEPTATWPLSSIQLFKQTKVYFSFFFPWDMGGGPSPAKGDFKPQFAQKGSPQGYAQQIPPIHCLKCLTLFLKHNCTEEKDNVIHNQKIGIFPEILIFSSRK